MSVEEQSPETACKADRERPWWRLPMILVMIALPASGLWYFWDEVQHGGRNQGLPPDIGRFNVTNSFNSSVAGSRSSHSRFACRKLLLMNRCGSDELMREVSQHLQQRLGKLRYVESIASETSDPAVVVPPTPQGQPAPDLVVTLGIVDLKKSDLGSELHLDATIAVRAGNRPFASHHYSTDNTSPPVVEFDWNGTLKHQSTTGGIAQPGAKYQAAAEDIAKQIGDALDKQLNEWRDKCGVLPKLPPEFYPAFRPAPALPLAEGQTLAPITSWHGLMTSNDTLWNLQTPRDPVAVMAEMQKKMEAAGWKTTEFLKLASGPHLRMTRDAAVVEVFLDPRTTETPNGSLAPKPSKSGSQTLYVRYLERMAAPEREAAMRALLQSSTSPDVLLLFENQWDDAQSRQALDLLKARQAKTPEECLTLARLHHRVKQDNEAGEMLLRAHVLLRTVEQEGDLRAQVENLAKELGKGDLLGQPVTPEMLAKLGFVELRPGDSISREVGLDEPVCFFATTAEGEPKTMSIRVARGDPNNFEMAHVDVWGHTRSWGKGGMNYRTPIEGVCDVQFHASQIRPNEQQFKLTAKVSPRKAQDKAGPSGQSSRRQR